MRKRVPVIAIHGGAGLRRGSLTPAIERAHLAALRHTLQSSYKILKQGGSAIDAVCAAVMAMEDEPLFNAGRGSVFNASGEQEMDAAVMDGATLNAGAVAALRCVKNPVKLARCVMETTSHIFLVGKSAEAYAEKQGMELVEPSYFHTKERWSEYEAARRAGKISLDHESTPSKLGTVGAVARDSEGHLAAATSTGGMTNKMPGRVGDSPIIGAGTYASPYVAISCTGRGEEFMRRLTAHTISTAVQHQLSTFKKACAQAIADLPKDCGGLIAISAKGDICMPYNTAGMFRGCIDAAGKLTVAAFKD